MSQKLTIRAFFFNAKTDYLPYYKNFTLLVEDDATAKDLLVRIQEANDMFSFPKQKLFMKINGLVVEAKQSVASIIERLGSDLQIDPISSYRSNDGLKINDSDFMASYALLEQYATEEDLKYYKTLYALHYASETENFDREYIGDAILILADKMIKETPENQDAIIKAITSVRSGLLDCEYENNLFNAEDHTKTIDALKSMAKPESKSSIFSLIMARFSSGKEAEAKAPASVKKNVIIVENLADKHIAHYTGLASHDEMHAFMHKSGMKDVHFSRANKLSGLSIFSDNKNLALKKAGTILLDAFDAGAEVVVVEDVEVLNMFIDNFREIENVIGRKMIGLELISTEDFMAQISTATA